MADYESGREALQKLADVELGDSQQIESARNEASTRYHIIDLLVTDVLCWHKSAVKVERHEDSGYSDYELGSPSSLLLEAKKEGVHFSLPAGWDKEIARLETLFSASEDTKKAVQQAIDYAVQRGIPYAAICNGHQLIAFLASRQDGTPPIRGTALIYKSQRDMLARFAQLWDALSPPGLAMGGLSRILGAAPLSAPPQKLSASIVNYPGYKNRNPIATELQILGGIFLEDLTREPGLEDDFLQQTYCTSGALSQYALVSKELLQARYASVFENDGNVSASPAASKRGVSPELTQDVVAASLSRRPILLVGDVGAGKSIFIRYLIKVAAKEALERALVLYIDFGTKPALASDLRPYVVQEIVRQLRDDYELDVYERDFVRGVYHGELLRFERGIYADLKDSDPPTFRAKEIQRLEQLTSDTEQHLKACLTHAVRGQRRQVVLFLDNVDQRPGQFQEEVFLIAQALADQWPLTAFVALRPETFAESRVKGSLTAYQPRVFTIDPPRVDLVLRRRLAFALKQLAEQGRLGAILQLNVQSDTLKRYISMLLRAFENEESIIEFVDNMSAGNIRRALDFVAAFFGSGHVDSQKILRAEEKEPGSYRLPLHEFLRAVTYGDNAHYDPSKSPILNVYDVSSRDGKEHFLVGVLVAFTERAGQLGGSEGYVMRDTVFRFARSLGFQPSQVQLALRRCIEKRLLATPATLSGEDYSRLRVTTVGAYTIKKLMFFFTYLDAVVVDTPILDPSVRAKIRDVGLTDERLVRAEIFLDYLDEQWVALRETAAEILDWSNRAGRAREEIRWIKERLRRIAVSTGTL